MYSMHRDYACIVFMAINKFETGKKRFVLTNAVVGKFPVALVLPPLLPFNPFTPKSDQVQISPVASPVILHHTV